MSEINPRKLKVQELRTELRSRGLSEEGKKQELVERLENFLDAEALGDDLDTNPGADQQTDTPTEQVASEAQPVPTQEVVAAPVTVPEPSSATTEVPTSDEPTTKKVVKITEIKSITEMTEAERLAARAARFGLPAQTDEEAKKAARAQRFDIPQKVVVAGKELTVKELDARKKRMERFGVVTEQNEKLLEEEKKRKRAERFGVAASGTNAKQVGGSDKKAKRVSKLAEQMAGKLAPAAGQTAAGTATALSTEEAERRKKRLERFGTKTA